MEVLPEVRGQPGGLQVHLVGLRPHLHLEDGGVVRAHRQGLHPHLHRRFLQDHHGGQVSEPNLLK